MAGLQGVDEQPGSVQQAKVTLHTVEWRKGGGCIPSTFQTVALTLFGQLP